MSDQTEIKAKVQYYESIAPQLPTLDGEERARLQAEILKFYDSLDPTKKTLKGAAAGAAVGTFVPGIGTLIGGLIGGAIAALQDDDLITDSRERLKALIDRFGEDAQPKRRRGVPPPIPAAALDPYADLERLKRLLDGGIISPAEYAQKREVLLQRIG